ncbi:MAG: 50S ribosomal protein L16 [Planctomycetota bacterium]|nr:50S ribosomal protein L16 [Planctomycetota bacterium]MDA0932888.1 50S ribosomal protein L16 [Planctomycetota bacterium]MDA1221150.1 50S ribosomal protein L16 [Planctomycetota bacterium]
MMMPKRVKWRKQQRGRIRGNATRGATVAFGDFGLQALEPGWIPSRTIEAARIACSRGAPEAKIWIRIFPHKSVTSTPAETRLGTGKGDVDYWTAVVKPGTVLLEIGGVSADIAKKAFNRVAHKLPVKVRMVTKRAI